jgi:1-deoxy-D-xylulose-5-phosphate reductoisomerase
MEPQPKRHIAILGSTGSIGTQALDVIGQHRDLFEVELLTAYNNSRLLIEQAKKFNPAAVVICNEDLYDEVFAALDPLDIHVFAGIDSVCELVKAPQTDIVLTAMVGFSGLRPTIAAIRAGKAIALANKETLVAAGALIMPMARQYGAPILPVDSEHSAIFQCLQGEHARLEKILLTGSGGPFLHSSREEIAAATRDQALNHPRWRMGAKVTIDSASLMNKGLELIEAHWLFGVEPGDIEVVIHPQSIIHSMVQFSDGCVMAQLSQPDMRLPIQYALSYPRRIDLNARRIDFAELGTLTFEKPDLERFPCLRLAYESLERGGNATCTMNGANEVAVAAFLEGKIRFTDIPEIVATVLARGTFLKEPGLEDIYSTDFEAKQLASELVNRH